jgi:hypothetical protein
MDIKKNKKPTELEIEKMFETDKGYLELKKLLNDGVIDKEDITKEIQINVIKNSNAGYSIIQDIFELNITHVESVLLESVKKNGYSLRHIIKYGIKPTEEMLIEAIKNNQIVIELLISNNLATEKLKLLALNSNKNNEYECLKYIDSLEEQTIIDFINDDVDLLEYFVKYRKIGLLNKYSSIKYIYNKWKS